MSGSGVYYLDENGERQEMEFVTTRPEVNERMIEILSESLVGARVASFEYPVDGDLSKTRIYFENGAWVEGNSMLFAGLTGEPGENDGNHTS